MQHCLNMWDRGQNVTQSHLDLYETRSGGTMQRSYIQHLTAGDLHLLCHCHFSADSANSLSGNMRLRLLPYQASWRCVFVCVRGHVCAYWSGWMSLKSPSLRLCMLPWPREQCSPSQGDRLGGSCIVKGRQARHTSFSHPMTHTHTHIKPLSLFNLFFCASFVACGLNYSSSLAAFRVTNSGAAA